jgi:integrase
MPRPRPAHLQRHKTRHGEFNWYVRIRRGPLIRIKETYGTPEFKAAYDAAILALSGRTVPAPKTIRVSVGTIAWAWQSYRESGAWKALSSATQRQRDNIMKHVIDGAGREQVTSVGKSDIVDGVERRSDTPSQAKNFLQTMNQFFDWLVKTGKLDRNPCDGVKASRKKTQGFLPWSYEDILAYENHWPLGTRQRVMLDVYCYTGLRRGDAARVGPGHVHNNTITLATEKSQGQTVVHLPMLAALKATLAAGPTGKQSFIAKDDGLPYTKESLGNAFKDACVAAGILNKSAHGLRKAAATRAAENGATAHELMAIFGWVDIKEAEIYTRAADRKRLAAGSMNKLEA